MLDFYERRSLKGYIYSKPVAVILALLIILLAYNVWGVYRTQRLTVEKREEYKVQLDALQKRHDNLAADLSNLESEAGIDREIRQKFEVNKEGEKVLIIVDEEEKDDGITPLKRRGFFGTILGWFGVGE